MIFDDFDTEEQVEEIYLCPEEENYYGEDQDGIYEMGICAMCGDGCFNYEFICLNCKRDFEEDQENWDDLDEMADIYQGNLYLECGHHLKDCTCPLDQI